MKSCVSKSLAIALLSVAGSLAVTSAILPLMGRQFDIVSLVLCIACPFVIAFPVSFHTCWQKEKHREAHDQLAAAHRELAAAHARLAEKACRDDLTGLLNRESFLQHLEQSHGNGQGGVLLMIDADDFKAVNDTHGHLVGDDALRAISAAITRVIRSTDRAGRIGGEEIAVLLSEACEEAGSLVAERIRQEVENIDLRVVENRKVPLSVSIGVASMSDARSSEEALREADRRLYAAKHGGRNRVVFAPGANPRAA